MKLTRIGLLTPYNGSNLGDGTIQTAVIENFLSRDPALEFLGITLGPGDTTQRHKIPAFAITGLSVPSYSEALVRHGGALARASARSAPPRSAATADSARPGRLRSAIKTIPLLGGGLRFLAERWRAFRRFGPEARHLWQSYKVVRTLDLLLVSGGGQLDEEFGGAWGHPYVLFRWAMLARLAGTPLAFASVGVGFMNRRLSRFFMRAALASAAYRSYRDEGSQRKLAEWRFTESDPCVPDLAFSLRVADTSRRRNSSEPGVVGLSPMIYGHAKHWPTSRPAVYEEYSRRLATFAQWLLDRGHTLLLFESSSADRIASADLKARLAELAGPVTGQRILHPEVETVEQFFNEVAAADCVVASRLHGVLMSHMLGKPVVAISFDRKVDAHMDSVAQTQYRVDITQFEVADLIERFTALERNAESERATVARHVAHSRALLDAQYDTLFQLAAHRPVHGATAPDRSMP